MIDAKRQARRALRFVSRRHVLARPRIRQVRKLFLPRILVPTAAVLVVRRDRRVVVARDAGIPLLDDSRDDLVRPWRVADEIAEVVRRVDVARARDVREHRIERRQVGVNVGDECVRSFDHAVGRGSDSVITVADAGHAPLKLLRRADLARHRRRESSR